MSVLRHLDLSSRTSKVQLLLNGEAIVTIAWFLDLTRRSSVVHRWRVTMVIGRHLHRPMVLWKTVEPRMIHFGFRYILPHFTVFYLYECIVFSHYSLCLSFCQCHTCLPFGSSHGEMRMLRMMRPMGWRRSSVVHRWRVTMVIGRHLHRPMVLWKTVEPRMIHFGFRYILPHFTVFYLYECIVFSHYSLCLSFCQCHTCLPFGSSHGEMRMLRMMRPMGWREAVINGKWMVWFMKKT